MRPRTFHIANFGCRASQSEGAAIEAELTTAGVRRAESAQDADVLVVNSCTVTEEADRDVRRLIRRTAKRNQDTQMIVTGCYAQRRPQELARMPQVRYVVGNSNKALVPELVQQALKDPAGPGRAEIFCSEIFGEVLKPSTHSGSLGRTRVTLKVQDGCDSNCSFCIIPTVRGRSRSLDPRDVLFAVRDLVERGYREVVFSGIHLGSYGRDLAPRVSLRDLVLEAVERVPGLERLRLSSIEPLEVTAELIDLVATHPRIAKHMHVPMQSGSRDVLRAMRRPYSPEIYAERIRRIHDAMPLAGIGADVMVGFPGEGDDDFLETYRLIESLPLTYLHVFPYSPRPSTAAASMDATLPVHVARHRGHQLRTLMDRKTKAFRDRLVGEWLEVLVLDDGPKDGWRSALSDNFVPVRVPETLEVNRWHTLRMAGSFDQGLEGSLAGV